MFFDISFYKFIKSQDNNILHIDFVFHTFNMRISFIAYTITQNQISVFYFKFNCTFSRTTAINPIIKL